MRKSKEFINGNICRAHRNLFTCINSIKAASESGKDRGREREGERIRSGKLNLWGLKCQPHIVCNKFNLLATATRQLTWPLCLGPKWFGP